MKKDNLKAHLSAFILLAFFISHHSFASFFPAGWQKSYLYGLIICHLLGTLYLLTKKVYGEFLLPLFLSSSFFILGVTNLIIHQSESYFTIIAPIASYVGYVFVRSNKMNLAIFDVFFIGLYIFFYNVYFSLLPNLFFRPGFDEDGVVFDMASSNAIPAALNITLFAYIILNRLYTQKKEKYIFFLSLINLILILIQQSRSGIIIALFLFGLSLFEYSRKNFRYGLILIALLGLRYSVELIDFLNVIGDIKGVEALKKDGRGDAQASFFEDMDVFTFIFGHTETSFGAAKFKYTYNVFLDMWDRYGFLQVLIFFSILFHRIVFWKNFKFPLYYFIPFLFYSMVESIFFPQFWDIIIYLLLFTPKSKSFSNMLNPLKLGTG